MDSAGGRWGDVLLPKLERIEFFNQIFKCMGKNKKKRSTILKLFDFSLPKWCSGSPCDVQKRNRIQMSYIDEIARFGISTCVFPTVQESGWISGSLWKPAKYVPIYWVSLESLRNLSFPQRIKMNLKKNCRHSSVRPLHLAVKNVTPQDVAF